MRIMFRLGVLALAAIAALQKLIADKFEEGE